MPRLWRSHKIDRSNPRNRPLTALRQKALNLWSSLSKTSAPQAAPTPCDPFQSPRIFRSRSNSTGQCVSRVTSVDSSLYRQDSRADVPATGRASDQTSPRSPGSRTTSFEDIPPELKIIILSQCADFATLNTLLHASPLYHQAHLESRRSILLSVAVNELPLDAFYSFKAKRLREKRTSNAKGKGEWVTAVKDLLSQYRLDKQADARLANTFSWKDVKVILRRHRKMIRLTSDFCDWTLARYPSSGDPAPPALRSNLSSSETLRIHRAFYRLELYVQLFRQRRSWVPATGPATGGHSGRFELQYPELDHHFQALTFLNSFQPWEIQEIVSVRDYMERRFSVPILKLNWDPETESDMMDFYEDGSPTRDDSYLSDYREAMIARGPLFLIHFLGVASAVKREELIKHKLQDDDDLSRGISDAVAHYPGWAYGTSTPPPHPEIPLTYKMRHELPFVADDARGPNQAWVWANEGCLLPARDGGRTKGLRQWGYVMWDKPRLHACTEFYPSGRLRHTIKREIIGWYEVEGDFFGEYCSDPYGVTMVRDCRY